MGVEENPRAVVHDEGPALDPNRSGLLQSDLVDDQMPAPTGRLDENRMPQGQFARILRRFCVLDADLADQRPIRRGTRRLSRCIDRGALSLDLDAGLGGTHVYGGPGCHSRSPATTTVSESGEGPFSIS